MVGWSAHGRQPVPPEAWEWRLGQHCAGQAGSCRTGQLWTDRRSL